MSRFYENGSQQNSQFPGVKTLGAMRKSLLCCLQSIEKKLLHIQGVHGRGFSGEQEIRRHSEFLRHGNQ